MVEEPLFSRSYGLKPTYLIADHLCLRTDSEPGWLLTADLLVCYYRLSDNRVVTEQTLIEYLIVGINYEVYRAEVVSLGLKIGMASICNLVLCVTEVCM